MTPDNDDITDETSGDKGSGSREENPLGTVLSGAGWILGGRVTKLILGFLVQILLARVLQEAAYGELSLAITVISFAGLFAGLGVTRGVERNVAYYEDEPAKARGIVRAGLVLTVGSHLATGIALFFLAPTIATKLFDNPDLVLMIRIAAVGLPFMALRGIGQSVATGSRDATTHVISNQVVGPIAQSLLVAAFVLFGYGAAGAILGRTLAKVLMTGIALWLAWRVFPIDIIGEARLMYRELLGFSLPLLFAGWMTLFIDETDYLVIGFFHSEDLVGIYTAMFTLRPIMLLFFFPATFLLTPVVARLQKDEALDQARRAYQAVSKWTTLVSLPLFLLGVLFPTIIIELTFGARYIEGAFVLQMLMLSGLMTVVLGANDRILIGLGHTRVSMYTNAFAALTNVVLNLVLVPSFAMIGAAVASLTAFTLRNVANSVLLYRWYNLTPLSMAMMKLFAVLAVLIPVGYLSFVRLFPVGFLSVAGAGILFLLIYVPLVIRLGASEAIDIELLEQLEDSRNVDLTRAKQMVEKFSS